MGKCPFSFLHGKDSRSFNEGSPARQSEDGHNSAPAVTQAFHNLSGHGELNEQMRMIDLTEEDLVLLRRLKPIVEQNIDYITEQFYNTVLGVEKLEAIIQEHSSIERLKKTLRQHIIEIFDGKVDEQYIAKRLTIANIHKRVGLEPKWYLSAFQNLQNVFIAEIYNETGNDMERLKIVQTVTKLLSLEQQLVLEAYEKANIEEKEMQYQLVKDELKQKIAEFSGELIDLSMDTNAAVEQLVASSNEVNNTFRRTAASALDSQGMAKDGHEHLDSLSGQINLIYESTNEMERSVNELNGSSLQIQKIVAAVEGIASQTKILALNATIEAARAGEHGRGFSVVANEVSRLAEDTRTTVVRIGDLTRKSGALTAQVVDEIRKVQELTESGKHQSANTSRLFKDIVESMQTSTQEIVTVEEEIKVLIQTIEGIGSTTAQTAASAEYFKSATQNL
ncbi:globin-coupled sensor protein [Paenibacillus sp. NFR01]|uniref:globin-coupled sensor protein n=1 Tax=Paenibacillus sp. NFR01 TaxID=1566279 RepID=UPI0008D56CF2|nr:globin-coupled sensor protein [Paenibacillus sp. NFR01]SEU30756.1 heam-based aerotactic trancducer [Paenibacillus sp. NFR01]